MYNNKNVQHILTHTGQLFASLEDSVGCIWIGGDSAALFKYDGKSVSQFTIGLPRHCITKIVEDNEGNIWIGKWRGVFRSEERNFQRLLPVDEFKDVGICYSIFKDSAGNLWFGTMNSGVCRYNGKQFQWFTSRDGLASDWSGVNYEDSKGHFGFGSRDGGVTHFDGKNFQRLTTKDGLPSNSAGVCGEDEKTGTMLFTTEHGII